MSSMNPRFWIVAVLLALRSPPFTAGPSMSHLFTTTSPQLPPIVRSNRSGLCSARPSTRPDDAADRYTHSRRPLVNLSFAINYYFGGLKTTGYHAVNLVLHFLSSLLVWAIISRGTFAPYFRGRFEMSANWLASPVCFFVGTPSAAN